MKNRGHPNNHQHVDGAGIVGGTVWNLYCEFWLDRQFLEHIRNEVAAGRGTPTEAAKRILAEWASTAAARREEILKGLFGPNILGQLDALKCYDGAANNVANHFLQLAQKMEAMPPDALLIPMPKLSTVKPPSPTPPPPAA
jgi:hypothetical protein